ncbi:hypothetical protein KQY30_16575 [Streptomyces sp. GMY02]|uniref:hypothetical protein n=1 Tax=Streptomyces sp. GMY02 TaxID=1333528 RepID=UPI001C2C73E7|nr:hypothetical protein [Streptomyces sp. GMY02]QXE35632.1 hypothetical protein KQY30_16575 [Streptomyces sp. GMY02]
MAVVFACVRCDAVLTAPVSRRALPVHAHQKYGHQLLPALMESGTYAVDPEPSGPPWRPRSEIGPDGAEARGVFAPVSGLSFGAPGAIVVAPGDTRDTVLIPERCGGYCMGLDGSDGPNLACAGCGQEVGTRIDDCSYWQAVRLDPRAVRRLPTDGPACRTIEWEALAEERPGTPPVEQSGRWDPRWEAATGAALAHLLAASEGAPVTVPDGLLTDMFGRALAALLPPGPSAAPTRKAALAGPGLPALTQAGDIALVPCHPQTGKAWQPHSTAPAPAPVVPLAAEVWTYLNSPHERLPVPATGGLPDDVLRDDPLPPHPRRPLRPDWAIFLNTLAHLPAVHQPWLRRIYDDVRDHPYVAPF